MADSTVPDKNPYLLRAMHQWMSDSGHTPHVIVDATRPGVEVPAAHVKNGRIVLNISLSATQHLTLGNDVLEFNTRFSGRVYHVKVPIGAVMGIFARETNEGMVFAEHRHMVDAGVELPDGEAQSHPAEHGGPPEPDAPPPRPTAPDGAPRQRPTLKIVK